MCAIESRSAVGENAYYYYYCYYYQIAAISINYFGMELLCSTGFEAALAKSIYKRDR